MSQWSSTTLSRLCEEAVLPSFIDQGESLSRAYGLMEDKSSPGGDFDLSGHRTNVFFSFGTT
jgi:hypothetical protein